MLSFVSKILSAIGSFFSALFSFPSKIYSILSGISSALSWLPNGLGSVIGGIILALICFFALYLIFKLVVSLIG